MMTRTAFRSLAQAVGVAILAAGIAQSATAPQFAADSPKGKYAALNALPDWGGIWIFNWPAPGAAAMAPEPPLKGQYLKDYREWQRLVKENHGDVPKDGSNCRPPGFPMIMSVGQYPIEFLFTPGRVSIHFEAWMQWRLIFTDGRGHPGDLDPTFNGDSIGTWHGDVLEIETVGLKNVVMLQPGIKHSNKVHIKEQIHLAKDDANTLVDEMTIDDPEALEKPWTRMLTWKRTRDGSTLLEFICAENDRNPVDASGHTGFQ